MNAELLSSYAGILTAVLSVLAVIFGIIRYFWKLHLRLEKIEEKLLKQDDFERRLLQLERSSAAQEASLNIILKAVPLLKERRKQTKRKGRHNAR